MGTCGCRNPLVVLMLVPLIGWWHVKLKGLTHCVLSTVCGGHYLHLMFISLSRKLQPCSGFGLHNANTWKMANPKPWSKTSEQQNSQTRTELLLGFGGFLWISALVHGGYFYAYLQQKSSKISGCFSNRKRYQVSPQKHNNHFLHSISQKTRLY